MKRTNAVFLSVLLFSVLAVAQQSTPLLKIDGKIAAPVTITQEDWSKLPRATVSAARGHSKDKSQFEGVPLKAVLEKAGVLNAAKPLHGKQLLQYLVFTANDGYRVIFSLAEVEEATGATTNVLLADKIDGKPLTEKEAPLQLVVPSDKRPERFVRMVNTITVGTLAE
jgi:DMSO/TMAO reductase YedYZ molybdopterin-dependent catalytic subunit